MPCQHPVFSKKKLNIISHKNARDFTFTPHDRVQIERPPVLNGNVHGLVPKIYQTFQIPYQTHEEETGQPSLGLWLRKTLNPKLEETRQPICCARSTDWQDVKLVLSMLDRLPDRTADPMK